jgi:hypothetical protein
MAYQKPDYPAVLTKANWDKNKGLLAKMAGFTGMGDSLTKLKAAYDKVKWDNFEIVLHKPNPFTLAKLETAQKAAVAEMNGNAAALRTQAYATRDLAKKTEAQFKAAKTIPASSVALCTQIATAADHLGVGVNANSLGSYIEKDVKEARAAFDLTFEKIKTSIPKNVAELEKGLNAVGEPTPANWQNQHMMTLCRNLNQLIGNVPKLTAMGYVVGIDAGTAQTFFQKMMPFASKEAPFDNLEGGKKAKITVAQLIAQAKNIH